MSIEAITAYADRFNRQFTATAGVASPLGAWLLLALVAPLADGDDRAYLERELGLDVEAAARFASGLLADPPDAVKVAVACWTRPDNLTDRYTAWRPAHVERGGIPEQVAADAWTRAATDGLVDRYPVEIDPEAVLLLTSALVTRISWAYPLDVDDKGRLVLEGGHGRHAVVPTASAGPVALASPESGNGLRVLSVIAAPDVPPDAVHRAAHEIASSWWRHNEPPASSGHAWTVTDRRARRVAHSDVVHDWTARLPAWSSTSRHDLSDAPGMATGLAVLSSLVGSHAPVVEAVQSTAVSYTATGFEAAAVTAMAAAGGGPPVLRDVVVRDVLIDFDRPHAVLAVAENGYGHSSIGGSSAARSWNGVPVFSAWVDSMRT